MSNRITSSTIAKLAHCSQSSVSRALNPKSAWQIGPTKRMEILELCRIHGYSVRQKHPGKLLRKTMKVGFLLGDMESDLTFSSFSFMLRELCDALQAYGYTLTLIRVDYTTARLARNVRRILNSDTADLYIAGECLLQGQTLDLLHTVGSRLICYAPFCAPPTARLDYRWISQVDYDYADAHHALAQCLNRCLVAEAMYVGFGDDADKKKYAMLNRAFLSHHLCGRKLPKLFFPPCEVGLWDQAYRHNRLIVQKYQRELTGKRLYFCGSNFTAYALADHLREQGLVLDRDFHIVTYGGLSHVAKPYALQADPFSAIAFSIPRAAQKICELAMKLVDDPVPQKIAIPVSFVPSPAFGGSLHQII